MVIPALLLPYLCFENVYSHLEIPEIIMLSQCSKRMRTIVRAQERRQERTLQVWIHENQIFAAVLSGRNWLFEWAVCLERCGHLDGAREFVEKTIEGESWRIAETKYNEVTYWISVPRPGGFENDLHVILQTLRAILQYPVAKISIKLFESMDFDKLLKSSTNLHTAREIVIECAAFSSAEMDFMLETFNAEKLCFSGYAGKQYSHRKPVLRFPNVQIDFSEWITPSYFASMTETCKRVELWKATEITDDHLNRFIKTWMTSTNDTLEEVEIYRGSDYINDDSIAAPFEYESILADVDCCSGFYDIEDDDVGFDDEGFDDEDEDDCLPVEVEIKRADGKRAVNRVFPTKFLCIGSEPLEPYLIFWIQYLGDIFNFTITTLSLDFNRNVNFNTVFKATSILHEAKKIEFAACGMSHEDRFSKVVRKFDNPNWIISFE